jgi:hypothetical protein
MSLGLLMNVLSIHRSAAISHSTSSTASSPIRVDQTTVVVPYRCHHVRSNPTRTGPASTATVMTAPPRATRS